MSADSPDPAPALPPATPPAQRRGAPPRRWSMSVINFWLDAALLLTLTGVGWVTAILQVVFPPPTRADGWRLWGWSYDAWRDVQFGSLCVLAAGVVLHVMLHWNWVVSVFAVQIARAEKRPDDALQTVYGVALLIVLLNAIAAGVIAALLTVQKPA